MTLARMLLAIAAVLCASGTARAAVYPPNPTYVNDQLGIVYPYRGVYYDPAQAGTGIMVDVGNNGQTFIVYFNYTDDGTPTWYIIEGAPYVPSDEVTRWTTGVLGTMNAPLYATSGGQCLGCAYKPNGPEVATSYSASLTWVNSREVRMVVGPMSWDFIAPNMESQSDGDYLVGNWAIHFIQDYDGRYAPQGGTGGRVDSFATIKIAPAAPVALSAEAIAEGATAYQPNARTYTWTCLENDEVGMCDKAMDYVATQVVQDNFLQGRLFFWFDPQTNRLGMDVNTGGQVKASNTHVDLYIQDPDLIVGRGIREGTGFNGTSNAYNLLQEGAMNLQVVMQRLPDGVKGQNMTNTASGLTP